MGRAKTLRGLTAAACLISQPQVSQNIMNGWQCAFDPQGFTQFSQSHVRLVLQKLARGQAMLSDDELF